MRISRLKFARKLSVYTATFLALASMAVCHFGIESEIRRIPPEIRAKMSDTDWVGVEWAMRSFFIDVAALFFFAVAIGLWIYERRKTVGAAKEP